MHPQTIKMNSYGFTLLELIIVLVILAILSVKVMPRYLGLHTAGNQAAVNGVAGALGAASATNYGVRKANPSKGSVIANCQTVTQLLPAGTLPIGYTITSLAIMADTDVTCTVQGTGSNAPTATFTATGIN